jgi:hypothetical protein
LTRGPGAWTSDSHVVRKVFDTLLGLNNLSVALFTINDFIAKVIVELVVYDFRHIGILSISNYIRFDIKNKFKKL